MPSQPLNERHRIDEIDEQGSQPTLKRRPMVSADPTMRPRGPKLRPRWEESVLSLGGFGTTKRGGLGTNAVARLCHEARFCPIRLPAFAPRH